MSNIQATEKLTPGCPLPEVDVTFRSFKFKLMHETIMDSAVRWAEYNGQGRYGDSKRQEAGAYIVALSLIITGVIPDEAWKEILVEYRAMLRGARPGEVTNGE